MNILGITSGSESGAALFCNNRLCHAVSEERLSRKKHDASFPFRAIHWCLEEAELTPADIDLLCYGFSNGIEQGHFIADLMNRLQDYADDTTAFKIIIERLTHEATIDAERKREFIQETTKIFPDIPVHYCHHHEAHRASAFFPSPFEHALVVTADGRGDFKSFTIAETQGNAYRELYHSTSWESLGYFYGRVTHLCGFTANRHEGKIVGLAAHGNPVPATQLMHRMVALEQDRIRTFPGPLYRPFFTNYAEELLAEAKNHSKEDLAAAAQLHLEKIITALIKKHLAAANTKNICLAGGIFANVKLNQRIRDLPEVEDVYIYPNMGDGGLCTGSVFHYLQGQNISADTTFSSVYLGPEISAEAISKKLQAQNVTVTRPSKLLSTVVNLLASGHFIGLVQGKAEFGPRSLGNRSILASCTDVTACDSLNKRLDRSEFMPFAPVITADLAPDCLKNYNNQMASKYMTITYDSTDALQKNAPAVIHIDGTVRPQVLHRDDNIFLYDLLMEWFKTTGNLCLMNTSFNLHEDPIVTTLDDVLKTFAAGAVDHLLFPPYLASYS